MAGTEPVDLRSDTVTTPTPAMRRTMAEAVVGDDGYGEDPSVRALEERFAALMGKEAAVLVPSGTMGNQVALRVHAVPGTSVVVGCRQHVVLHEAGGAGTNAPIQWHAVDDGEGTFPPEAVTGAIEAADHHGPEVSAVFCEDTHMPSGGRPWPEGAFKAVTAAAAGRAVHLDGARLWNAAVATGIPLAERAAPADTVMACLSKGLGAPVGSLLAGSAELIAAARRERKRLGGEMRQAGVIAAAGLVALDDIDRLAEDHARAATLAATVAERWPAALNPEEVATNMVVFGHADPTALLDHLAGHGVWANTIAPGRVRLATHRDVDDAGIARAVAALRSAP